VTHDKTGIENYTERVNKQLSDPSTRDDVQAKILPEYGQTTSISLR